MQSKFTVQEIEFAINKWLLFENCGDLGPRTSDLADIYGRMIANKETLILAKELSSSQLLALTNMPNI